MKVDMHSVSYVLTHPDKTTTTRHASVSVPDLQTLIHHYLLSQLTELNAGDEVEITEIKQGERLEVETCKLPRGSIIRMSPAAPVIVIPRAAADVMRADAFVSDSPGPCCDSIYHAADSLGELYKERCTRMATTRIRVNVSDGAYVAKVCAQCAEDGVKTSGIEGNPLKVEILGEFI